MEPVLSSVSELLLSGVGLFAFELERGLVYSQAPANQEEFILSLRSLYQSFRILPSELLRTTVAESQSPEQESRRTSQATQVLDIFKDEELFHTPDREAFATVSSGRGSATYSVKSEAFEAMVRQRFYEKHGRAPSEGALQEALGTLSARAQFEGTEHSVFTRVGWDDDNVYLDLANEAGEAVRIGPGGWQVVEQPTVKFRRVATQKPLPVPTEGGDLAMLRPFVNCEDAEFKLILGWLLGCFQPDAPYPHLILQGDQGSGKSTTAKNLVTVLDPKKAPLRSIPRSEGDLLIAANNCLIPTFDNLSGLKQWLSDALCRLSTGGGAGTRTLYSNFDESVLEVRRPVLLTGITDLATAPDLIDRSIICWLPAVPGEDRKSEADCRLDREPVQHARILGALCSAVSSSLANRESVDETALPRMADFVKFVLAAESHLPSEPGPFLDVYRRNIAQANRVAVESCPVASGVVKLASNLDNWSGTATQLLEALEQEGYVSERTIASQGWPKNAKWLSDRLRKAKPALEKLGVRVEFDRKTDRQIRIRRD